VPCSMRNAEVCLIGLVCLISQNARGSGSGVHVSADLTNSTRSPGLAQSKIEQIEKGMTRYDLVGCGALAHEYETKTVKARDWQGYHPLRNEHNGLTESDKTLKTDLSGRLTRQELSLAFSGTDSCTCIQNCKLQTPHRRVLVSLPV
jgi:hypothetical protein